MKTIKQLNTHVYQRLEQWWAMSKHADNPSTESAVWAQISDWCYGAALVLPRELAEELLLLSLIARGRARIAAGELPPYLMQRQAG